MNFYQILNVKQTATKAEIKSAYKSLIKKYHPDIYKGDKAFAERKTKEINEAFDTLSDPTKKAEYDASIAPKVNYSDYYSSYSNTNSSSTYRPRYSEPSKYSPYSNRRKQTQAEQYKNAAKGTSSASYTERVIFTPDDFNLFKNSLQNKKTANIVLLGFGAMLLIILFVIFSTFSQLTSFYNSTGSYIERKRDFRNNIIENSNNTHAKGVYSSRDVSYYVLTGDTCETVRKYLGSPDREEYNYDYLFWYYNNSYIVFELNMDYEVIAFHDLGDLVVYYD